MKTFKKIILDDMKANGLAELTKKIKSIKYQSYSGGDSVRVQGMDLLKHEREALEKLLEDYQEGRFDGMQDMYIPKTSTTTKERTAKYVFLDNEWSNEAREEIKSKLKNEWDIVDDKTAQERMGTWYDQAIYRLLNEKGA